MLVPSVVTVEALTGGARDASVNQVLKQVDVQEYLPLAHARAAAVLRQGTDSSAVDAVVAEAAVRTRAAYAITSDADDLGGWCAMGVIGGLEGRLGAGGW